MALKLVMKAQGLATAQDMMRYLNKLGASVTGAALMGRERPDGTNNTDILQHQADGIQRADGLVVRDILPNKDDATAASKVYLARAEERLRTLANAKAKKAPLTEASIKRIAENAQSSGLKAAAQFVIERMRKRIEGREGSDGTTLEAVTARYAARRQAKYGVGPGEVLKASGELLRNLEAGNVKLSRQLGIAQKASGLF